MPLPEGFMTELTGRSVRSDPGLGRQFCQARGQCAAVIGMAMDEIADDAQSPEFRGQGRIGSFHWKPPMLPS